MKYLERQIDDPCHKLETCIWSSHSQFGTWKTLNYSFEVKENQDIFCEISWDNIPQMTYNKGSSKEKESHKVSTAGILYLPNIYLIIFHLILHSQFFL